MVYPLRVDAFLYGSLGLSDDLSELGILRELVPVRLPLRGASVSVQEGLSLPAASGAARGDPNHGPGGSSEDAPGTGGLRGAVVEVTGVPERRDKRTRLVHCTSGGVRSTVAGGREKKVAKCL